MAQAARQAARRSARSPGRHRVAATGERPAARRHRRRRARQRAGRRGARRRDEAPRLPTDAARRSRDRPQFVAAGGARDRPDGESALPRVVQQGPRALPLGVPNAVRRRRMRCPSGERRRAAGKRNRDPRRATRQADAAHPPALLRRAHARRGLAAVRHFPRQAEPVLPARRGGRTAGRRQRRALRAAAGGVQESDAVHRHHTQSEDDAGSGCGLWRHDAGAGCLDDRRRPPGSDGNCVASMRRFLWIVFLPAGLAAQQPAVSPVLPKLLQRVQDTTVSVWLFARPGVSLDALSERVAAAGARVRVRSRWLNAISADVPSATLRTLLQDRDLRRIQPLGRFRLPANRTRTLEVPRSPTAGADTCPPGGDPIYGPSDMPYRRLHLRPLSDRGHRGAGVRVAIFDTGFDTQNPAFSSVSITAQHDFVFGDSVVRDDSLDVAGAQSHGTATWSLFAADVPGRLRGVARGASYLLAKTEDIRSETRVEEDNYVAALEWADSIGVDIISS